MAVTAIWSRKSRLEKLVDYAINPAKTSSAIFTKEELEGMKSIGGGSGQTEKLLHVSYLNCMEDDTAEDMNFVKTRFGKTGGIVAYHGYQSFKPGEVTPDIAHEIGVKLAEKMWGDRFQVVVATHLDHEHIHNHFVINSVSHLDGTKYNENKAEYKRMRETSDELCREYGLSVIGEQQRQEGKKKQYGEWKADRDDRLTWRTLIREDIDRCIANASSFDAFIDNLAAIGYDIKGYKDNLKYISIRPEGKERYVRMTERSLGYGYGEEQISQRIEQGFITERSQTGHRPSLKTRRNPYTKSYTIIGIYRWF
ncbi:MAG: relaxase/mobilization nuclease domain-containing protein, partial [Lachnospiraceae bacterium]|nr:relaxase/mobilization nuclease domain-containing protein [Lachnospiraceae bacterium]